MNLRNSKTAIVFYTGAGAWRCTDVGTRTIEAIKLDHEDDPSWYIGPPYKVAEEVFDEYAQQGCSLDPREWDDEMVTSVEKKKRPSPARAWPPRRRMLAAKKAAGRKPRKV